MKHNMWTDSGVL